MNRFVVNLIVVIILFMRVLVVYKLEGRMKEFVMILPTRHVGMNMVECLWDQTLSVMAKGQ